MSGVRPFLEQVQPDQETRRFLYQWFGLNLTGDISEQAFVLMIGTGRNGKSTLVSTLASIAGDLD
jgi:phage/plasmid-associated DNA primase